MAITDHGVMYGAVDFYKASRPRGSSSIIGCEFYVGAQDPALDKVHQYMVSGPATSSFCAAMRSATRNLCHMVSQGFTEALCPALASTRTCCGSTTRG